MTTALTTWLPEGFLFDSTPPYFAVPNPDREPRARRQVRGRDREDRQQARRRRTSRRSTSSSTTSSGRRPSRLTGRAAARPLPPAGRRVLREIGPETTGSALACSSPSSWRYRSPFCPAGGPRGATSSREPSRSVILDLARGERVQPVGALPQLGRRLRAAQHQQREHGDLRVVERERAVEQVAVLRRARPGPAREPHPAAPRQPVERRTDLRLLEAHTGSRVVDWFTASRSEFSESGYWSGVVRCFSIRQPRTRSSTGSASMGRG